jgi:hypothetical protein
MLEQLRVEADARAAAAAARDGQPAGALEGCWARAAGECRAGRHCHSTLSLACRRLSSTAIP